MCKETIRSTDVSIRLADTKDIETLTQLHWASFKSEDHVPMLFGKNYIRAMYRWLITGSLTYTLVAECDKKVVGLVAVCDGSFTGPMFMACLRPLLLSLFRKPTLMFKKALWLRLFRRSDKKEEGLNEHANTFGEAQMVIAAVDAGYRGEGVFGRLIAETIKVSKKRGSKFIRAGVYKSNTPCRLTFEKGGWIESSFWSTPETVFYISDLNTD